MGLYLDPVDDVRVSHHLISSVSLIYPGFPQSRTPWKIYMGLMAAYRLLPSQYSLPVQFDLDPDPVVMVVQQSRRPLFLSHCDLSMNILE